MKCQVKGCKHQISRTHKYQNIFKNLLEEHGTLFPINLSILRKNERFQTFISMIDWRSCSKENPKTFSCE